MHEEAPFTFTGDWSGQLIATAIHTGHGLRPETAELMVLDEADRLREEDPFTDLLGAAAPAQAIMHRSRFEVDLNRPRREAVYRRPEDCWGFEVWKENPLPDEVVARSLEVYDAFYEELGRRLDAMAERGPFAVYDVHSYNHRRDGVDAPAEPLEDHPEINLGTGSVDMDRFSGVVEAFTDAVRDTTVRGKPVLKPLQGSGGSGVFLVNQKEAPNLDQIIEAIARDGYVVAQEYLPEAKSGDVRMFVMNGQPLEVDGRIAAFRRRSSGSDMRSNMSAGGKAEAVEVNVFSPGGLGSCEALYDIDFSPAVIADLERKVNMRAHYGAQLPNKALNTI